jgi:hypothetical protein
VVIRYFASILRRQELSDTYLIIGVFVLRSSLPTGRQASSVQISKEMTAADFISDTYKLFLKLVHFKPETPPETINFMTSELFTPGSCFICYFILILLITHSKIQNYPIGHDGKIEINKVEICQIAAYKLTQNLNS